jgi:hypothetical protein
MHNPNTGAPLFNPNGSPKVYRDIWKDMTVSKFVGEKFNTQILALNRYTQNATHALDPTDPTEKKILDIFNAIKSNPDIWKDVNADVKQVMEVLTDPSTNQANVQARLRATELYSPTNQFSVTNPANAPGVAGSYDPFNRP